MKSTDPEGNKNIQALRARAEAAIKNQSKDHPIGIHGKDFKHLYQELQLHKVELEMQYDELQSNQAELLEARDQFTNLYHLAPVAYFTLDFHGIIKRCNVHAMQLLCASKNQVEERRFMKFICLESAGLFMEFLLLVKTSPAKQSCIVKFQTSGNTFFYGQVEGVRVEENRKAPLLYLAVIDITDKKESELKLKESKESLDMALCASGAGTWYMDIKSRRIFLDEHAVYIMGAWSGLFTGTLESFCNCVHPDDRKEVEEALNGCIRYHTEFSKQFRIIKPDQSISFVEASGHFIMENGEAIRFTGIVIDITKRKKMEEEVIRQKMEEQIKILNAVIRTQESERKRISEVLHDSLGQLLYAIKLKLGAKETRTDAGFYIIDQMLEDAINQTRNISFELSPAILIDFGLLVSIEETLNRVVSGNIKVRTDFKKYIRRLNLEFETTIYRIFQELLNNVIKHAAATEVIIVLAQSEDVFYMTIEDNGTGFDAASGASSKKGTGLSSIKNRVQLLDGRLKIASAPGKGTRVSVELNIKE